MDIQSHGLFFVFMDLSPFLVAGFTASHHGSPPFPGTTRVRGDKHPFLFRTRFAGSYNVSAKMNFLAWILGLPIRRAIVRESSLASSVDYLRASSAEEKGPSFPNHVLEAVVQEAYNRAGGQEKDGRARHGRYLAELHTMADQRKAAAKKEPYGDARIKSPLEFHRLT